MNLSQALRWLARHSIRWAVRGAVVLLVAVATLVVGFAVQARLLLPELQPWHRDAPAAEFRAGAPGAPRTFAEYLTLELRLFDELQQWQRALPASAARGPASRYNEASPPGQLAAGLHNHTYLRVPGVVKGSVLLVHGLSDSPYTLRALGDLFYAQGLSVLSLRLPGHGTVPAGLLRATWQDWYAAVELAARHLARMGAGRPLYACGYSTGAALLTLLSIRSLRDATLPRLDRLVLVSAAIGVSEFAALANVVRALAWVPYFERADWLDVLPEYDPFKYNSFPVQAGNQIYQLTQEIRAERDAALATPRWPEMPKVLAFQSVVDATVSAPDVVHELFQHLRGDGHELVAFDVNRREQWSELLAPGPRETMEAIRASGPLPFRLTLVANAAADSAAAVLYSRAAGAREVETEDLGLSWPAGVFALGHVALPIPFDDPLYGLAPRDEAGPKWRLGGSARGEAGAIVVPLGTLARLRCNPFFEVLRRKITAALEADLGR